MSSNKIICVLAIAVQACAFGAPRASVVSPVPTATATLLKQLSVANPALPVIEEVRATPISGVYELRSGSNVFYSDSNGQFLIQGQIIDVKARRNLTAERVAELSAFKFENLALNDSMTIKKGNGRRKVAVFEDPNCGYCKRFEKELDGLTDVTIHVFLLPILGKDSVAKAQAVWCAKEKNAVWLDWMLTGKSLPIASQCDTGAIARNVAFAKRYQISATPTVVFSSGKRVDGGMDRIEIERLL
ncbi:MAG: DsbC family protein [Comamonadaceae bacterium]|nr:MAG: DsbC family protein [Comamonadaceae bacterium]